MVESSRSADSLRNRMASLVRYLPSLSLSMIAIEFAFAFFWFSFFSGSGTRFLGFSMIHAISHLGFGVLRLLLSFSDAVRYENV